MRVNKKGMMIVLVLVLGISLVLSGCGGDAQGQGKVVIGAPNYTEPIITAEMMRILIEEHTDLDVEIISNMGSNSVLHAAMLSEEVDIKSGYTGTSLTGALGVTERMTDPQEVFDYVKREHEERWNITWLEPYGFQNTYALTMRQDLAEELGVTKVSDLVGKADHLSLATDSTFLEREGDGYPGLAKHYDFEFKETHPMDVGLVYRAAKEKQVDVVVAYSTDGRIPMYDLVVLEDDKHFFPPYHMATVVRQEIIETYPELQEVLEKMSGQISEEEMQQLNLEVDEQGTAHRQAAEAFLRSKGLIE